MKVFISWSGDISMAIAKALHEWLPWVIQAIEPFMSDIDIGKGTMGIQVIMQNLAECEAGIVCVTHESMSRDWVNFEAGALANNIRDPRVYTVLHELEQTDITGPLKHFQHTKLDELDFKKCVKDLNHMLDAPIKEDIISSTFDREWPRLKSLVQTNIAAIKGPAAAAPIPKRSESDMIREILEKVRALPTAFTPSFPITPLFDPMAVKMVVEEVNKSARAAISMIKQLKGDVTDLNARLGAIMADVGKIEQLRSTYSPDLAIRLGFSMQEKLVVLYRDAHARYINEETQSLVAIKRERALKQSQP